MSTTDDLGDSMQITKTEGRQLNAPGTWVIRPVGNISPGAGDKGRGETGLQRRGPSRRLTSRDITSRKSYDLSICTLRLP